MPDPSGLWGEFVESLLVRTLSQGVGDLFIASSPLWGVGSFDGS